MNGSKLESAIKILPQSLHSAISQITPSRKQQINEIRLRLYKPLTISTFNGEYALNSAGDLIDTMSKDAVMVYEYDIETVITRVFKNSLYSYKNELTAGYMTYEGGCRIGFCGTAVVNTDNRCSIENIKNISSVNIRIPREIVGCANEIHTSVFSDGLRGLLICGAPASGKTTLLRDLTRLIGNRYKVSLIDERGEIAASVKGKAQNDIGVLTDVFNSYSRYYGIMTAVRVMSPRVIVCDEIGSDDDLTALKYAVNSGVKIIASCHTDSVEDIKSKPIISELIKYGVFDYCVFLGRNGKVEKITDVRNKKCLSLQAV